MRRSTWLRLFAVLVLAGLGVETGVAQPPPPPVSITCLAQLRHLAPCQLRDLYARGQPGVPPVGFARGEVLYLDNTLLPWMKTQMVWVFWKGKVFDDRAGFINQWTGFRAIESQVHFGPSHFDGRPSLILEYPEKIPYFGKMRDEVRQVGPGVYLAMVYEKCPPHCFRGFVGLELEPPCPAPVQDCLKRFGR